MTARAALPCLLLCLCLGIAAPSLAAATFPAQEATPAPLEELTPAKGADVRRLLELSGGANSGRIMSQALTRQVMQALRQKRPDLPAQTLAVVERELSAVMRQTMDGPDGLLERLVPLYAKTFTHGEIREMLAFHDSPVGRKMAAVQPALMGEARKIGEVLARQMEPVLKRRLTEALSKEGVVLDRLPD